MTEHKRLTTKEKYPHGAEWVSKDKLTGKYCRGVFEATACVEKLAEYENAEEEGRLVVLPCKVGDVLYKPTRSFVSEYKVRFIEVSSCNCLFLHTSVVKGINDSGETFKEDDIGKTVFLTKEEAEKALKEMEEKCK